jgi:Rad3-related DNA helicase
MKKDILSYWPIPEFEPRSSQIEALHWLAESEKRYNILELPVGGGKSLISATYARYLSEKDKKASFILTPQKILQNQYERDFKGKQMVALYGKGNYTCHGKNTTCDIGGLVKPNCSSCPHKAAKDRAVKTNHVILNYKLALMSFAYTKTFISRSLLVADECHTLERHLVDFDALQITYTWCKKYNIMFKSHTNIEQALLWMKEYYMPLIQKISNKLEIECEYLKEKPGYDLTRTEKNKLKEFDKLIEHNEESSLLCSRTTDYINDNYVLVWNKTMFQFKRLTGGYSFNNILKPMAHKFLFMSSTILDKTGFCEDLQIPKEDTSFLSLQSEFPKENRPIYYMPRMKMNYSWNKPENKKHRQDMINDVKFLLDNHKDENGIIHTANFQIAIWLTEELKDIPHKIYQHNPESGNNRDIIIDAFLKDVKPRILISPSSTEGLDLKNELASFAIFVKTPYPYLGDQWIKRRMDQSSEWYQRQTLISIIQGGGRIVRSDEDKGTVYIIDASFGYLYKSAHHMIPKWWKEAYTIV